MLRQPPHSSLAAILLPRPPTTTTSTIAGTNSYHDLYPIGAHLFARAGGSFHTEAWAEGPPKGLDHCLRQTGKVPAGELWRWRALVALYGTEGG
jgi:hypothetical protein